MTKDEKVGNRLRWILDTFADKMYNPSLHRQEVFFDNSYKSLIDLYSYGHDIETSWLIDRGTDILSDEHYKEKMAPITKDFAENVYKAAFDGHSLADECDRGIINQNRVWWVQAETVLGFFNAYQKDNSNTKMLDAAVSEWNFIKEHVVDIREGSEWFWEVNPDGSPIANRPIVEPWKCPYHNGRMCLEIIKRIKD